MVSLYRQSELNGLQLQRLLGWRHGAHGDDDGRGARGCDDRRGTGDCASAATASGIDHGTKQNGSELNAQCQSPGAAVAVRHPVISGNGHQEKGEDQ